MEVHLFSKALKIILPACLDEITGWFRLFQSMGEIKAAFIYFYLFLLWADWAVSVRGLSVVLGRLNPGASGRCGSVLWSGAASSLVRNNWAISGEPESGCGFPCLSGELMGRRAARSSDPLYQSCSPLAVEGSLASLVLSRSPIPTPTHPQ